MASTQALYRKGLKTSRTRKPRLCCNILSQPRYALGRVVVGGLKANSPRCRCMQLGAQGMLCCVHLEVRVRLRWTGDGFSRGERISQYRVGDSWCCLCLLRAAGRGGEGGERGGGEGYECGCRCGCVRRITLNVGMAFQGRAGMILSPPPVDFRHPRIGPLRVIIGFGWLVS